MYINFFGTTISSHLYHGHNVIFVGVNTARGEQTHQMNCFAISDSCINSLNQLWILLELTIFDGFGNTGQILINHTASAQIHVAHFTVTHLAIRQTNVFTGAGDQCVRIIGPQTVDVGGVGSEDSIGISFFTVAPAIENN